MTRQRRILLHPGFHRTGTASVGAFLTANRAVLAPHIGLLLSAEMKSAAALCTNFAGDMNPLRLTDLVDTMDGIMAENCLHPILHDTRDIVISCPAIGGLMPGAAGVDHYEAAPVAIAYITGYLTERYPDAEVVVVMTTRAPHDWLYSAWRAHLCQRRLKLDWAEFREAFAPAANLDHAVIKTAQAIDPTGAFTLPLEDATRHKHGPGGALLELIDLPEDLRRSLTPVPPAGVGPSDAIAAQLLELNRSGLPRKMLEDEKALILRAERAGAMSDSATTGPDLPPPATGG